MGAKNPQFAGKIVINEQVGNGIFFSEDLESPILGIVEGPFGDAIQLEADTAEVISLGFESVFVTGGVDSVTGAGALDPSVYISEITTTGADALTLADGEGGELKSIYMLSDGGDGTLTPTNLLGYSTITFNDVGDAVQLYFNGTNWVVLSAQGVTLA